MQQTALQWLVFAILTDSAWILGKFNFLAQLPILLLGLLAGALADAVNRHRVIVCTQALMMVYAAALAVLTLLRGSDGLPLITIEAILLLAVFNGVVQAFDLPARQAFLHQLVPKPDLPNAVALNSLTFNTTRILGPALAGSLAAVVHRLYPGRPGLGEGVCFALNAVSFLAVLISLLRMDPVATPERKAAETRTAYLLEGIRYVRRNPHLMGLNIFVGIIAVFALPYLMLTVVYAKNVVQGGVDVFGYLNASIGVGAIAGGLLLVRRNRIRGLGKVIALSTGAFSIMILLLAWNPFGFWAACPLIGLAGFSMVIAMISSQTLLQTLVAEEVRGRVMSLYTMLNVGLMPFGSLFSGWLTEHLGVRITLAVNATACLVTVIYFLVKLPALRRAAQATPEYRQAVAGEPA